MPENQSIAARLLGSMPSLAQNHAYWMELPTGPQGGSTRTVAATDLPLRLLMSLGVDNPRILEVGCSDGLLLSRLWQQGLERLSGVDISRPAIARLQNQHPELFAQSRIYNLPVEDVLGLFGDAEFDIVCCVNVLSHIHPSSDWVFPELARIAGCGLLVIEDEESRSMWERPRNYRRIFEACGLEQLHEEKLAYLEDSPASVARLFRRPAAPPD